MHCKSKRKSKRKNKERRSKNGGLRKLGLAKTLVKAAVPFGLLALQRHTKRRRSRKGRRSSKNKSRRR